MRVTAPRYRTAKGWRVNKANLERAIDDLGLKLPVTVRYRRASQMGEWWGFYDWNHTSYGHNITISTGIKRFCDASNTLWHELYHAKQKERLGTYGKFKRCYNTFRDMDTNNPFEIEANKSANRRRLRLVE